MVIKEKSHEQTENSFDLIFGALTLTFQFAVSLDS